MNRDLIKTAQADFEKISLAVNYRGKGYEKNFNTHLDLLVETSFNLNNESIFKDGEFKLTNALYWKTESFVLERLDDIPDDSTILNELDNLEDFLHELILKKLGKFNDNSSILKKMIDISVHDVLLSIKFNNFSRAEEFKNPWDNAKDILFVNNLLHIFSDEIADFKEYGLKLNDAESEITRTNYIGILGKGYQKKFATGYIRDLISLRNNLYQILDDNGHTSAKPIKTDAIIKEIRNIGIKEKELTDSNIKNWLITPLKHSNRLGSNKDGYFVIKNFEDLLISYNSHFENFKGYYNTLERHRTMSKNLNGPSELTGHIQFMMEIINKHSKLSNK